jgi:carboxyl-terminal processing protease
MRKKQLLLLAAAIFIIGSAFTTAFNSRLFEIAKNIEIFSNIYKEINTHYVDDLDPAKTMKIGIDAMLDALDPYTTYISEAEVENFRLATEGKYEGIGARIVSYGDELVVIDVYKDAPADKAGLKIADRVVSVNGQSAKGRDGRQVMRFLRGAPGTSVDIQVERPGEPGVRVVTIERAEIARPSVPYSGMVGDDIAYVSLSSFTQGCGNDVVNAFKKLDADNQVNGFILDLRDNGGGLLSEAVNVSNIFIPKNELVVTTKAKVKSRNRSYDTKAEPFDTTRPLVVLINKRSASASEIVSGTIQDYDRGVLMGQLSFGKGLVQNTKEVGYNSRVKITTAKYYIPSGRCIQAVEYENGEPVRLADSLRASFKTRNGREVLDGGGVKPDIELADLSESELLRFLNNEGLIFNFVTDYLIEKGIDSLSADFSFVDFEQFKGYFMDRRDNYESSVEKALEGLKKELKKDGTEQDLRADVAVLRQKLEGYEIQEVEAQKDVIVRLIETEIVKRFELDRGRAAFNVNHDPEVKAAVNLLHDPLAYSSTLDPK